MSEADQNRRWQEDEEASTIFSAAKNMARGNVGRSWMAVRDMDVAAEVIGIRLMHAKLLAFAVSSFYCGVAGALWLICISRDGMRNVLVPLFGALMIWALIRWADRPGRVAAIVAGAVAGAGLWTYQPLKLTPLLLAGATEGRGAD